MAKKTLSISAENKVEERSTLSWLNLNWSSLSSISVDFHFLNTGGSNITGWRIKIANTDTVIHDGIVKANDKATISLSPGVRYAFQICFLGSWLNGKGPSSYGSYFSGAEDPVFTLYEESGGGGSTTPTVTYATNSISFDESKYYFGSTGGTINYSRSTSGTGKAPVLYIDETKIDSLGDSISSGQSTNESFPTTDYEGYFDVGEHTVELKVAEHTGSSVITRSASASTTVVIYKRPSKPVVKQVTVASSAAGSYLNTPTYDSTSSLYVSENGVNYEIYSSSIFFTKGKTYYFKATHKITSEDSEVLATVPVVSNTAKAITISSVTPTTLTAQSLLTDPAAVYARKVTVVVSTDAVSYSWYYRAAPLSNGLTSAEEKLITTTSESSQELTINDSSLKMGYYYQVGVAGTDNYGDTSAITWWTSETFQIAPTPTFTSLQNYFTGDSSFDTTLVDADRFYTDLTFSFEYNSEITKSNIAIQYKKTSASSWNTVIPQAANITLGDSSTNGTIKVSLPSTLEGDKEYEFRIRYILLGLENFSNVKNQMYQINKSNIVNNLTIYGGQEVFKPYTEEGTLELRIAKPYESSFKENYTSSKNFQCQIIIKKNIVLLDMLTSKSFQENSDDDTVSFFFDKSNIYSKLEDSQLDKTTLHKAELKLAVDNVFGLSHSESLNITIDYRESPTIVFDQPKFDDESVLNSDTIIKEGNKITFKYKISDYNPESLKACIQINRSDTTTPGSTWVDYGQESTYSTTETAGHLKPVNYTDSKNITIGEITLPKYIFFRLRVSDSSGDQYSEYYSCGRSLQHTTPIIQQLNVTYKEEGNTTRAVNSIITGQLSLIDLGVGLKEVSSLDLIDAQNSSFDFYATFQSDGNGMTEISGSSHGFNELIEKYQQNKNLTFTLPFNFDGVDVNYATLQIRARTKINYSANNLSSDKTFDLSPFIVFNTLQTVSYRKNRLAINVRDFDTNPEYEKAILVIGQADSSKNEIIYSTPNGSGHLINFVIDCGEW